MTTIDDIVAAIVAALAVNHGTYDLSGVDSVKEGLHTKPPGRTPRPFACVLTPDQVDGVELSRGDWVRETHDTRVRLWAPVPAATTEAQAQVSRAMVAEVKAALGAARRDQPTALAVCEEFAVRAVTHTPADAEAPLSWAYAELTLRTVHLRDGRGA